LKKITNDKSCGRLAVALTARAKSLRKFYIRERARVFAKVVLEMELLYESTPYHFI